MRKMQSLETTLTWCDSLFFSCFHLKISSSTWCFLSSIYYHMHFMVSSHEIFLTSKNCFMPKTPWRHRWEHLWWPWLLSTNLVLLLDAFFCFFIVFCLFPFSFSPLLSHKTKQNKINPLTLLILCFCVWNMKCGHVLVQASFFLLLLWQ
jgi:hypothetical protein